MASFLDQLGTLGSDDPASLQQAASGGQAIPSAAPQHETIRQCPAPRLGAKGSLCWCGSQSKHVTCPLLGIYATNDSIFPLLRCIL
jgi:hypothetical protein